VTEVPAFTFRNVWRLKRKEKPKKQGTAAFCSCTALALQHVQRAPRKKVFCANFLPV